MLTREQKQQLNELSYSQIFFSEHNGIPLDNVHREPVSIPDFTELQEYAFQTIRGLGFTSINLVMPWRANLIVRLFYKRHYPYDCLEMHNLYGYLCYTRSGLSWVTDSNRGNLVLFDPSKCVHRCWFYQDEYVDYDCNFIDFYLKIK